LHGARNRADHSFKDEVLGLLDQLADAHRIVCYSDPGPDDRAFDVAGRLTGDVLDRAGVPTDADVYLCGPGPFMHDMAAALVARGTAPERIGTEPFGPADAITPGIAGVPARSPHPPAGPAGAGPSISFSRSNLSVAWDESFASLLEFAEACDVPVRWSCRTGVCHTCETGLVSGDVSYRPDPLEAPEAGSALICCSRPRGEVTLDL
jgi:ferredoxin